MKKMKKLTGLMMALAMLTLAACQSSQSEASQQTSKASEATASEVQSSEAQTSEAQNNDKIYKIGVLQLEAHPALDATYEGFVAALAEEGFVEGENIEIDYKNAQGEISNCPTIASKLVNDKNDLILAIATPAAQAVASATKDIPVLVTAVTDPENAKLVESNEMPGTNVSGTSDLASIESQMKLLQKLSPEAKKVGLLYCSSEANSIFQVEMAKEELAKLGLEFTEFTVSSTNELQSVVTSMIGKVDAVYSPTDNLVAKAMPTVAEILNEQKIPMIVGAETMVDDGALASVSVNYLELGRLTGVQAASVLRGEAKPAEMPIQYQENVSAKINPETAAKLGIEIPEDMK